MQTGTRSHRSRLAGGAATLALAAMGFAGTAQARDSISWSVGVGIPGTVVNVGNVGSVYPRPVYVQPQPVYIQPAPVYVQPAPRYYYPQRQVIVAPPPVYLAPQPIYYERRHGHRDGGRHFQGNAYPQGYGPSYGPNYGPGYGPGYGQVYYQQDHRDGYRHDGRR